MTWAVGSLFVVESVVVALAALPAVAFWSWHVGWPVRAFVVRVVVLAMAFVPTYLLFAAGLAFHSAIATRLLGWRTAPGLQARVADYEWPLLDWGRYLVMTHLVRVLAGAVFRSTPMWGMYLRLNGARVGRGAWVNSLGLMDHNLLDIGDHTVIGSDAHVAGHIVEGGVLRTAPVRLGRDVTIGIGSVIEIGVTVGDGAQVGALSVVPKHARLEPGVVYVGAPVRPLRTGAHSRSASGGP